MADPSPGQTPLAAASGPPLDHAAIRAIVWGIMLAAFLSALEQTIVAPALPGRATGSSRGRPEHGSEFRPLTATD